MQSEYSRRNAEIISYFLVEVMQRAQVPWLASIHILTAIDGSNMQRMVAYLTV